MDGKAENYQNDETVELAWAMKAHEDAEIHYSLITSVDPTFLHLAMEDDKIYKSFREMFPSFDIMNIHEDDLKSPDAKKKWRSFCNKFDDVKDFNYGALLRLNPMSDYNEETTIFATRIQFLAIETARNREGLSKRLYDKSVAERRKRAIENINVDQVKELIQETSITS